MKGKLNKMKKILLLLLILLSTSCVSLSFNPNDDGRCEDGNGRHWVDSEDYIYTIEEYKRGFQSFEVIGTLTNIGEPSIPSDCHMEHDDDSQWYIYTALYSDSTFTLLLDEQLRRKIDVPIKLNETIEFNMWSYNDNIEEWAYPNFAIKNLVVYF